MQCAKRDGPENQPVHRAGTKARLRYMLVQLGERYVRSPKLSRRESPVYPWCTRRQGGIRIIDSEGRTTHPSDRMAEILVVRHARRDSFDPLFPDDVPERSAGSNPRNAATRALSSSGSAIRTAPRFGWTRRERPTDNAADEFRGIVGTFAVSP
jgi:hypothetical protein